MAANFTNENFHRLLVHLKQMGDATNFHSEMSEEYKQFISLFPLASLPTLTLDQYCIGKGDSSSFAGGLSGATAGIGPLYAGDI